MTEPTLNHTRWREELEAELRRIIIQQSAKEVASKRIGSHGLAYITAMVLIGVVASFYLSQAAITAVMAVIGAALMAIIQMLSGITGVTEKPDRPEFEVIRKLIEQMERLSEREQQPMVVDLDKGRVMVRKGVDKVMAIQDEGERT